MVRQGRIDVLDSGGCVWAGMRKDSNHSLRSKGPQRVLVFDSCFDNCVCGEGKVCVNGMESRG